MSKTTLKKLAYDTVRHNIINCIYGPGTLITEEVIQEQLRISRTPIREAINKLEQEGLVKIAPKKGIIISDITLEMINMVFEARLLLEPYLIKTYGNRIDHQVYLTFYKTFEYFVNNPQACVDFTTYDAFHTLFVDASKNDYFARSFVNICAQNQRIRVLTHTHHLLDHTTASKEHLAIASSCLENNWEEAAQKTSLYLQRAKSNAIQLMLSKDVTR